MDALPSRSAAFRSAVLVGFLAAVGCSSNSFTTDGGVDAASPFNGSWSCSGSTTYTFTTPKSSPLTETDPTTSLVLAITNGQPVTFTTLSGTYDKVGTDGGGCSVTYDTSGTTASLASNPPCPVTITVGATVYTFEISYLTGSATVSGKTLTATQADSFTGTVTKGGASEQLAGTITGSKTCTR